MNSTITAVSGIEVGHYTDMDHATGCTVIMCRRGAVGGVDVRGGSPGTRETDLLRPMHRVDRLHAVVLSGGSAFGLDSASGVVNYLSQQGIGVEAGPAIVPIVSAAILFDLALVTEKVHPTASDGFTACLAASTASMPEGTVGAGTGATVGKVLGLKRAVKSGIGSASVRVSGGITVTAAVAVNAYGGVVDHGTGQVLAGPRDPEKPGFLDSTRLLLERGSSDKGPALTNTTIGVVATDATLTKEEANFLAGVSHDGLAMTIRPCHSIRDGDTMFAMATGTKNDAPDITVLGAAAVEVTAQAVLRAIQTATGLGGVPSIKELGNDLGNDLGRG